jgi:hypothetical protein
LRGGQGPEGAVSVVGGKMDVGNILYRPSQHNTFIICKMWATSFGLTFDHLPAPTSIQLSMNKTDKMCNYFKKQLVQDDILYRIPFFQVLNISYQHSYSAYVYNISNSSSVHMTRSASIVYLQIHLWNISIAWDSVYMHQSEEIHYVR